MKLITKAIADKLPALYANEDKMDSEVKVPLKLFNPSGAGTWYITEYDPDEDMAFGWSDLGMGPGCSELGNISIAELRSIRCPPFGLGIERDINWDPNTTLAEVIEKSG